MDVDFTIIIDSKRYKVGSATGTDVLIAYEILHMAIENIVKIYHTSPSRRQHLYRTKNQRSHE